MKKIKILTLGDHPYLTTGVAIQTRYMIEGLLKTGNYSVVSLGGSINDPRLDKSAIWDERWKEDWKIFPVGNNGVSGSEMYFGNPDIIRSVLRTERPDIMWIMTDPRYWQWLWGMEDEIRSNVPIVYYHVWDNYPIPHFNTDSYLSNDAIISASKLTRDILSKTASEVDKWHIPHTVDTEVFKKYDREMVLDFKEKSIGSRDKFVFFWNNRNGRRKMSASLLWWFCDFIQDVGRDKAVLIMHTDPKDPYGADITSLIENRLTSEVFVSTEKYKPYELAMIYNMADVTINIADAEGFGLSTLESLACETPIIVNMTGGLKEQVQDYNGNKFGIGIEPAVRIINSSQRVPYIFEDKVSREDFLSALHKMYLMPREEREKLGELGRKHVINEYDISKFNSSWNAVLTQIHELNGSWSTRKNYRRWRIESL